MRLLFDEVAVNRFGPHRFDAALPAFAFLAQAIEFLAKLRGLGFVGGFGHKSAVALRGGPDQEQAGAAEDEVERDRYDDGAQALAPLVLGGAEAGWTQLAGVSADVKASAGAGYFREKMLVTHRGLSGPAILQASSYWRSGEPLLIDFAPQLAADAEILAALRQPGARRDAAAQWGTGPARQTDRPATAYSPPRQ